VEVLEPAPADPFLLPLAPVAELRRLNAQNLPGHRVRVRGVVTLQETGGDFFVQDQSYGLSVESRQKTPLQVGDVVEVVGFPMLGQFSPYLQDAILRRVGVEPEPKAEVVAPPEVLKGRYDGRLVQVEGTLFDHVTDASGKMLIMQAGKVTFSARLEGLQAKDSLADLRDGSLLRLTGICWVQGEKGRSPRTFQIILRSPKDVSVLRQPQVWSLQKALKIFGIVGLVIVVGLAWLLALQQRVRKQTEVIRQRIEQEAALEQRYRDLCESAQDIIYTRDLAGNFTSANQAAERVLGYSRDELLKMNFMQLIVPEHIDRVRQLAERQLAGEFVGTNEVDVLAKNGSRITLDVSARPIYLAGKPVGFQGIARDVTERKRAEKALQESEERYRQVVELSPEAIFIQTEGKIVFINSAGLKLFGAPTPDQVLGKSVLALTHPDFRDAVAARICTLLEERQPVPSHEQKYLRLDGSAVEVEVVAVPYDYQGQPAAQVFVRDISERKQAEAKLREAELRYRTLFEQSPDGILLIDPETTLPIAFNDAACRDLDYSRQEFARLRIWDYEVKQTTEEIKASIQQVLQRKQASFEVKHRTKTGEIRDVFVTAQTIELAGSAFFQCIYRDITEQERTATELANSVSLLQATLESTADGILTVNTEGKITGFNQHFVELWRIPASILSSRDDNQVLAYVLHQLTEPEQFLQKVRELYAHPEAESFDVLEFKDGRIFERYSRPQRVADRSVGRVWSFRDVTQRKQAEQALQKAEAIYHALVETLPQNIFRKDLEGRFVFANQRFCATVGKELAEILHRTDFDLFPVELAKKYRSDDLEVIHNKRVLETVEEHQPTSGSRIYVQVVKTPTYDSQGQVNGVQGIFWDITERKRLETEREKLITDLQDALANVKMLSGLLPICSACKKIRDDKGYWNQLESYIAARSEAQFTHGICPDCARKLYPELYVNEAP
jgi:PAS domain S-box-containing protein